MGSAQASKPRRGAVRQSTAPHAGPRSALETRLQSTARVTGSRSEMTSIERQKHKVKLSPSSPNYSNGDAVNFRVWEISPQNNYADKN